MVSTIFPFYEGGATLPSLCWALSFLSLFPRLVLTIPQIISLPHSAVLPLVEIELLFGTCPFPPLALFGVATLPFLGVNAFWSPVTPAEVKLHMGGFWGLFYCFLPLVSPLDPPNWPFGNSALWL